mgnify:CR=1 FL=1
MWKKIRILCLLVILLIVAVNAWKDKNQDWRKPVFVLLHPINADGLPSTQHYIQKLSVQDFQGAQAYLQEYAQQYRGQPIYFYFNIGRELKVLPPKVPDSILHPARGSMPRRSISTAIRSCMPQPARSSRWTSTMRADRAATCASSVRRRPTSRWPWS